MREAALPAMEELGWLAARLSAAWLALVLALIVLPSALGVSLGISEAYMWVLVKTLEVGGGGGGGCPLALHPCFSASILPCRPGALVPPWTRCEGVPGAAGRASPSPGADRPPMCRPVRGGLSRRPSSSSFVLVLLFPPQLWCGQAGRASSAAPRAVTAPELCSRCPFLRSVRSEGVRGSAAELRALAGKAAKQRTATCAGLGAGGAH